MADEFRSGVRHFDSPIGGSSSVVSGMLDEAILDAIDPWLVLLEVKEPKPWKKNSIKFASRRSSWRHH